MKLPIEEVIKLVKMDFLKISAFGGNKGATFIFYKGKSYYVWKNQDYVYFQGKWTWNKKHDFAISELQAK